MSELTLDDYDQRSIVQFIQATRYENISPSAALQSFIEKNGAQWRADSQPDDYHRFITYGLLKLAYPDICEDLRFHIIDNNYPANKAGFSDGDFDLLVEERLKSLYSNALS